MREEFESQTALHADKVSEASVIEGRENNLLKSINARPEDNKRTDSFLTASSRSEAKVSPLFHNILESRKQSEKFM